MKGVCTLCKEGEGKKSRKGKFVVWKEKKYHATCLQEMRFPYFRCAYCFKNFTDDDQVRSGNKPYHKTCLTRKRAVYRRNKPRKVSNFNSVKK